jgi:chromosome segregation ATPase
MTLATDIEEWRAKAAEARRLLDQASNRLADGDREIAVLREILADATARLNALEAAGFAQDLGLGWGSVRERQWHPF